MNTTNKYNSSPSVATTKYSPFRSTVGWEVPANVRRTQVSQLARPKVPAFPVSCGDQGEIGAIIGLGSNGVVYKIITNAGTSDLVMKCFWREKDENSRSYRIAENIRKLFQDHKAFMTNRSFCCVTQGKLWECEDYVAYYMLALQKFPFQNESNQTMPWEKYWNEVKGCVGEMHTEGIVSGDLKGDNVMLTKPTKRRLLSGETHVKGQPTGRARLIDLDASITFTDDGMPSCEYVMTTPMFMHPVMTRFCGTRLPDELHMQTVDDNAARLKQHAYTVADHRGLGAATREVRDYVCNAIDLGWESLLVVAQGDDLMNLMKYCDIHSLAASYLHSVPVPDNVEDLMEHEPFNKALKCIYKTLDYHLARLSLPPVQRSYTYSPPITPTGFAKLVTSSVFAGGSGYALPDNMRRFIQDSKLAITMRNRMVKPQQAPPADVYNT